MYVCSNSGIIKTNDCCLVTVLFIANPIIVFHRFTCKLPVHLKTFVSPIVLSNKYNSYCSLFSLFNGTFKFLAREIYHSLINLPEQKIELSMMEIHVQISNYETACDVVFIQPKHIFNLFDINTDLTRCSAGRSFIRPQMLNPERLGQVWTQHSSWI